MADEADKGKKKPAEGEPGWVAPSEDFISRVAGAATTLAVGAHYGPEAAIGAGAAVATAVKQFGKSIRNLVTGRGNARTDKFVTEIYDRLERDGGISSEDLNSPEFQEVVFQNYRRAMDAMDASVIPALARLTSLYRDKAPDSFFRAAGRLLQDLSADELSTLQRILSAALEQNIDTVEVVSWNEKGHWELLFSKERPGRESVRGMARPASATTVLQLLERVGLTSELDRSGTDLAMTGGTKLARSTVDRLLEVVGSVAPDTYPTKFR